MSLGAPDTIHIFWDDNEFIDHFQVMLNKLSEIFPHRSDPIVIGVSYCEAPFQDMRLLFDIALKYDDWKFEDEYIWCKVCEDYWIRERWEYPFLIKFLFADKEG
jgi:hypothetical protein